jgi:signal transduction histidine kinase
MEEALRESEQTVRQVLEEREQLSRDLHDGILQSLFAVSLGLESSRSLVREDVKLALRNVDQAIAQLKGVMREVRHFITGPHSGLNYKGNFEANVRGLVESMTATHPTSVALQFEVDATTGISEGQSGHLLNIIREGISNALRHASATQINLSISHRGQTTLVELTDDGVGLDKNAKRSGRGLDNMKARVEIMGGHLEIVGKKDLGTKIVLEIPHESTGVAH